MLRKIKQSFSGEHMFLSSRQIKRFRYLTLYAALVIPAMGVYHHILKPDSYDPLWLRFAVGGVCLSLFCFSYFQKKASRYLLSGIYIASLCILAWFVFITSVNEYRIEYALGMLVVFSGFFNIIKRALHLVVFGGFGTVANLVAGSITPVPQVSPYFIAVLFCTLAAAYIVNLFSMEKMERVIEKQKRLVNSIFEESTDSLLLYHLPECKMVMMNAVAKKLFQISENWSDQQAKELLSFLLTPDELDLLYVLPGSETHFLKKEIDLQSTAGKMNTGELVVNGISGFEEQFFLIRISDITERKERELAMRQHAEDLEKTKLELETQAERLNQTVRELETARVRAEAAAQAKSDFLANMSHELRTPLNGILGMSDLALEDDLNSEQTEYLKTIQSSGKELMKIVADILDFSSVEEGKMLLISEPFLLRESIGGVYETLLERIVQSGLSVLFWIDPVLPNQLIGDSKRVERILSILLENAIKFTHGGEVLLAARSDDNVRLRISISDTGIGIPEAKKRMIFDSFSQVDGSATRSFGGTGLGLSIAYSLIDRMGGMIWVESPVLDNGLWKRELTSIDTLTQNPGSAFFFEISLSLMPDAPVVTVRKPSFLEKIHLLFPVGLQRCVLNEILEPVFSGKLQKIESPKDLQRLLNEADLNKGECIIIHEAFLKNELLRKIVAENPAIPVMVWQNMQLFSYQDSNIVSSITHDVYSIVTFVEQQLQLPAVMQSPITSDENVQTSRGSPKLNETVAISHRIVLVEDNRRHQMLMVKMLKKLGYDVVVAENGVKAISIWQSDSIDLILMDIQMPEMDGYQATREIR